MIINTGVKNMKMIVRNTRAVKARSPRSLRRKDKPCNRKKSW